MTPASHFLLVDPENTELMGLAYDGNQRVFKWKGGNILFSAGRLGDAMSIHFAASKDSLRSVKQAISEFVDFVFFSFGWCTMIIANIVKPSVERLAPKLGFVRFAESPGRKLYMRVR